MDNVGTFQKTMLTVGEYHSPDGQVRVTPGRLKHWEKNFKRLDNARQVVPMHWDHGSDVDSLRPLSQTEFHRNKTRSAKNSVGKLTDFKVSQDGKSAEITFQTLDSQATSKVASNAVYVSPVIFPKWKDGAGNQYRDLITHLDLVNHPVDHSQSLAKKVEPQPITCCLRMGLSNQPFRLGASMADKDKYDDDEMLDDDIDMELDDDDEMLDDDAEMLDGEGDVDIDIDLDDDDDEMLGDDLDAEIDSEMEDLGMDSGEEMDLDIVDDGSQVGDLMLALADHDVVLPEDTSMENFMDRLRTALIAKKGTSSDSQPNSDFDQGETIVADPQIATMSSYATKSYNAKLNRNLKALLKSGRCTPVEYRQRRKQAEVVKLSLNSQGKPKRNTVSEWIRSRAQLPKGAVWSSREKLKRMSSTVAQHPAATDTQKRPGELTPDQLDREVKQFLRQ